MPCWHMFYSANDNPEFLAHDVLDVHKALVGSNEQAFCCNSMCDMQNEAIDDTDCNMDNNDNR